MHEPCAWTPGFHHDIKPTVSAVFMSGLLPQEGLFMFYLGVGEGILELPFFIAKGIPGGCHLTTSFLPNSLV